MFKRFAVTTALVALALGLGCTRAVERLRGVQVAEVEFLGEIWNEAMGEARVVAQDGGQTFAVPGGTLWAFGDTFRGTVDSDGDRLITGMAGSTVGFLPSGETAIPPVLEYWTDASGEAAMPFTLGEDESPEVHRIWPLGGITVGGTPYLFYSLIERTTGDGPWNFRGIGDGLARAESPRGPFERVRRGANGEWRFPVTPGQVLEADGWLWMYEVREGSAFLARVRPEEVENPAAYEFSAGRGDAWSQERSEAAAVADGVHGQVSVAWCEYLGAYLMATSSDFAAPHTIRLRTARNPWGPWRRPFAEIAVPERPGKTTTLIYGTYLHPEFFEDGGRRLVLTFCRMLEGSWELTNPEMVRVTLGRGRGEP